MHCERRLAGRRPVTFDVICDGEARYSKGRVTDVSESGLFIESERLLPMGTEVFVTPIGAETDELFGIPAQVVRLEAAGMGLRLGDVDEDDREGLQRLMRRAPPISVDRTVEADSSADRAQPDPTPSRARIHGGTRASRAWVRLKSAVRLWD